MQTQSINKKTDYKLSDYVVVGTSAYAIGVALGLVTRVGLDYLPPTDSHPKYRKIAMALGLIGIYIGSSKIGKLEATKLELE